MTIFFCADHHINHSNIIRYCDRPFADVEEMNEALVERHNQKVKPGDQVYILGDFALADPEKWTRRLNGAKYLIKGNHDKFGNKYLQYGFGWVKDTYELKVDGLSIWLAHYAHLTWPKRHYGAWHLFGHSHGKIITKGNSTDVGVDCWGFYPVSLEELREHFRLKAYVELPRCVRCGEPETAHAPTCGPITCDTCNQNGVVWSGYTNEDIQKHWEIYSTYHRISDGRERRLREASPETPSDDEY